MSELAIPAELSEGEAPTPASTRRVLAMLVCVALGALWFAAGFALIQGGHDVAVSAARAAAPVVQPVARLQERAEAMSATQVRQISAESAEAINAAVPVERGPNPSATPFGLANAAGIDRTRSLDCLTAAIYYEAGVEPLDGQRAVAQVVLNRVRHPAYPNTVCGVVFEGAQRRTGCQFSFACDGSLRRTPMPAVWERARAVAAQALSGYVFAPVGLALNYHANYVVPYWASSLVKNATIGRHIFYIWRGMQGRPGAFADRYAGVEPAIAWRGGFGQPGRTENAQLAVAADRNAAAIAAAEAAMNGHGTPADIAAANSSVDSFQRAVLRRYEPLQRESAAAVINETTNAQPAMSASQRWALTGQGPTSGQQPLGRRPATAAPTPPSELQGVRRRGEPAPQQPAAVSGNNDSATVTR